MLKAVLFLSFAAISCQAGILPVLPGSHVPIDIAKPQAPLRTANYSKPWFCHDNDCPKFTVVETNSVSIHKNSKTCLKRPLKNRQNKDLNDKW